MLVMAKLTDEQLAKIQGFEAEQGFRVLALADLDIQPAAIDPMQLKALQDLERDLGGKVLLAVK